MRPIRYQPQPRSHNQDRGDDRCQKNRNQAHRRDQRGVGRVVPEARPVKVLAHGRYRGGQEERTYPDEPFNGF
jgi:hypothetical protein